ncbi:hypothetical protein ROZALSC1DRAFT_29621 [Rozella allomycis CSF55]|uniref:3-hydroxy-3-methylglutaryl coenzyme A reductase n=1 Tax=Rozella allomycis (strain CSF55) TaxID=988480 RepID=A0A075AQJ7_ROZAC|nr:Hydroxymethylglutaryl-CoA reductase domain-containing protein [Rozella allomycis CSF55]RKP18709.1 hypothetical protein ROZALSC1DRAFT_29621 [Rozella allomycis CSF55]|eukprot:EPZ30867.1 Hydroxymethylglutaryl-CoA reductase domain-containing protein [Rozella allomycis CSF55]
MKILFILCKIALCIATSDHLMSPKFVLHEAVKRNDYTQVFELLQSGHDHMSVDDSGKTPLEVAIGEGITHLKIIQLLVQMEKFEDIYPPTPPSTIRDQDDSASLNAMSIDNTEDPMYEEASKPNFPLHSLEAKLQDDPLRAVSLRRKVVKNRIPHEFNFEKIPFDDMDYKKVHGACCENVIGYVPIPLGYVGPLKICFDENNAEELYIPMATTEGTLIASTNRGCKAITSSGGVSVCVDPVEGMTRAPAINFPTVFEAMKFKNWIIKKENFERVKAEFESTTNFGKLLDVKVSVVGRTCFARFRASTGDAMGMNMISKGLVKALQYIITEHPNAKVVSLSGNVCTDKKPSAVNWIEGRGKSVVAGALIPKNVVEKNLVGSAVAGSIGGFNAHAANIVTAIYIATGQDPAQNVESSTCLTEMQETEDGDLYVTCTMPSIEVGTVGGGTNLDAQSSCLEMLGVKGANKDYPGENAKKLAKIVCGAVMAGELSLMSALASNYISCFKVANTLVDSHMKHNRAK